MVHNFSESNSIFSDYISELRDVRIQDDRWRFRQNLERIGSIMAYEISKTFDFKEKETETPLGIAISNLANERVVVASILRAGLPLHNGFLHTFDKADNAFISAYRQHHKDRSFDIRLEYVTCPNLDDCVLILVDPMLATGASIVATMESITEFGTPKAIHFATAIASSQGVNHINRLYPKINIWAGAIDDELTAKSYIVPGLGDAGDLAFGSKVQD